MFHLNKQKIVISFAVYIVLNAAEIFACSCVPSPESVSEAVQTEAKRATMIFAGKVTGFEYRKGIPHAYWEERVKELGMPIDYETHIVKFHVAQWWKGEASSEMVLITDTIRKSDGTESRSSCDYSFEEGEKFLVYAYGKEDELRTSHCTRTKPLANAEEDLRILGEGKEPVEKKTKSN